MLPPPTTPAELGLRRAAAHSNTGRPRDPININLERRVTLRQHVASFLAFREDPRESASLGVEQYNARVLGSRAAYVDLLFRAGKLGSQYWVDKFTQVEGMRLEFIRRHQREICAGRGILYDDASASDAADSNNAALRGFILPPSFTGSPRQRFQRRQDAFALGWWV